MIVIDTSILISLEHKDEKIIKKLGEIFEEHGKGFCITFINLFEFLFGLKVKKIRREKEALSFLKKFPVLNSTEFTSKIMAELKYKYDRKGIVLPLADLIIASIAIENNALLITSDKDFEKIDELKKIII